MTPPLNLAKLIFGSLTAWVLSLIDVFWTPGYSYNSLLTVGQGGVNALERGRNTLSGEIGHGLAFGGLSAVLELLT